MATVDPGMQQSGEGAVPTEYWQDNKSATPQSSWWAQTSWFSQTNHESEAVEVSGVERSLSGISASKEAPGHATCFNRFVTSAKPPTQRIRRTYKNLQLKGVGGFSKEVMDKVKDYILLPMSKPSLYRSIGVVPPTGVLLSGTPGSGKTLLADGIDKELAHVYVQRIDAIDMLTKPDPSKFVKEVFDRAIGNAPALIFFDQLDVIARRADSQEKKILVDMRPQLTKQLARLQRRYAEFDQSTGSTLSHVMVLGATAHPEDICPTMQRKERFDYHIEITKPNEAGRLQILKLKSEGMKLSSSDCQLSIVAKETPGFLGNDLGELCNEAGLACIREAMVGRVPENDKKEYGCELILPEKLDESTLQGLEVCQRHFSEAILMMKEGSVGNNEHQDIPNVSWEDIGGQDKAKKALMEILEYPKVYPKIFKQRSPETSPPGLLLIGPPGCGKSLLAEAIAQESKSNFIRIKGPQLIAPYFGTSEKNIRDIFAKARANAPCVLFFDEIDAIGTSRVEKGDQTSSRIVTALLTELDGVASTAQAEPVYIIAASNRPNLIDRALLRPGRFGDVLMVDLPNQKSRVQIFKALLRHTPLSDSITNNDYEALETLGKSTKRFSGADIAAICNRARRSAIDRCVERALASIKIGATGRDVPELKDEDMLHDDEVLTLFDLQEAMTIIGPSVSQDQLSRFAPFLPPNYKGASAPSKRVKLDQKKEESESVSESCLAPADA